MALTNVAGPRRRMVGAAKAHNGTVKSGAGVVYPGHYGSDARENPTR
jgi:hypothetical protein